MINNLPINKPYKKFFGREDSIQLVKEKLLDWRGHIASIDGVGGIGKTALTYRFCEKEIVEGDYFDYLVWVSAKDERLDPFATEELIKKVDTNLIENGISTLINETIGLIGFEDYFENKSFEEKKLFFENEILKTEKIFFVIDNLESVKDVDFLVYINNFGKIKNYDLKVLTTSRRREKVLIDNAVIIEEISEKDAVDMLRYYAKNAVEKPVNSILGDSYTMNAKLVNRVGRIPLVIEFVVGQLAGGKNKGEIYRELDGSGIPDIKDLKGNGKNKVLSRIIEFSFKNMYEDLSIEHQQIFTIISAWERNKKKDEDDVSIDFIISLSGLPVSRVKEITKDLIQNQLIVESNSGIDKYTVKKMAINFSMQYYDKLYDEMEENVVELKSKLVEGGDKELLKKNRVNWVLKRIESLVKKYQFDEAEKLIKNLIDEKPYDEDYRLYHQLAKINVNNNQSRKADYNFRKALELYAKDEFLWYDRIDMEHKNGRTKMAFAISNEGLEETKNDILLVVQQMNLHKYTKDFSSMRNLVKRILKYYDEHEMSESATKLLTNWKNIEYRLAKDYDETNLYLRSVETLIERENRKDNKLMLLREEINVARSLAGKGLLDKERVTQIKGRIKNIEDKMIRNLDKDVKNLNRLFSYKKYEEAYKEANKILNFIDTRGLSSYKKKRIPILRVILQVLIRNGEYEQIVRMLKKYHDTIVEDESCYIICNKAIRQTYPEYGEDFHKTKESWKNSLSKNEIDVVFSKLKEYLKIFFMDSKVNEIIILERQFKEVDSNKRLNTDNGENISVRENKVVSQLLILIDEL